MCLPAGSGSRKDLGRRMPMSGLENPVLAYGLCVALVVGLVSACAARMSVGSRCQSVCQTTFLCCLLGVGLLTMAAAGLAPGFWLVSGATFSLMVLTATCDFRRSDQAAAW